MFTNKSILLTGGAGSLGREIVKQLMQSYNPRRIIIFSRDDHKHKLMESKIPDPNRILRYWIGDVRDLNRLRMAFKDVDYVIHAASLKHVEKSEDDPIEYKRTIVDGAENIITAALECGVQRVVALSTDKACESSINTYGCCKALSDKLFLHANRYSGPNGTKFSVIRYGNVIGSSGSATKETGLKELTIFNRDMTRFWIVLSYAAHLVLHLLSNMRGSELLVPRIPSMNVETMLRLANPNAEIKYGDIRNGEKIAECQITSDDARICWEFDKFYIVYPNKYVSTPVFGDELGILVEDGFRYSSDLNTWQLTKSEALMMLNNFMPDIR